MTLATFAEVRCMFDDRRSLLMEFICIVAMAAALLIANVLLAINGIADGETATMFRAAFTLTLGAVLALAYAARGITPPKP